MARKTNRITGYIVHIGPSRTAKFWTIIKDATGKRYFAYGRNFLGHPNEPKVGWDVSFTPLQPGAGRLPRATEITYLPRSAPKQENEIAIVHDDGMLLVVLRVKGGQEVRLGKFQLVVPAAI